VCSCINNNKNTVCTSITSPKPQCDDNMYLPYIMCALCMYNIMHVRFGHKTLRRRRPTTMTPTRRPTTIGRTLRHYMYTDDNERRFKKKKINSFCDLINTFRSHYIGTIIYYTFAIECTLIILLFMSIYGIIYYD